SELRCKQRSGRWDTNGACTLRLWRSRRVVPCRLVQSYFVEYFCTFMCVQSRTVSFRSAALLPYLLPLRQLAALASYHADQYWPYVDMASSTLSWQMSSQDELVRDQPRVYPTGERIICLGSAHGLDVAC